MPCPYVAWPWCPLPVRTATQRHSVAVPPKTEPYGVGPLRNYFAAATGQRYTSVFPCRSLPGSCPGIIAESSAGAALRFAAACF